jgi:hypothetical protein
VGRKVQRPRGRGGNLGNLSAEGHRRSPGLDPGRRILAENEGGLEHHAVDRSRAGGNRAIRPSGQLQFDLVDPEYGSLASGVPPGRERGRKPVPGDFVGAAISDDGVAARYPPLRKTNDARALAARGPEPCPIFAVLQHDRMLA